MWPQIIKYALALIPLLGKAFKWIGSWNENRKKKKKLKELNSASDSKSWFEFFRK